MASADPNTGNKSSIPLDDEANLLAPDSEQQPSIDFLNLSAVPTTVTGELSSSASSVPAEVTQTQHDDSATASVTQTDQIAADEQLARALQAAEVGAIPIASSNYPAAPAFVDRLSITIFQAKLQKNYGLLRMDPYCKVRIGNSIFATPTADSGGKNPTWNRTVQCILEPAVDSLYLEIYDEGTFAEDELVAWAHIQIPPEARTGHRVIDWYSLSGKQGDGKEGVIQIATQVESVPAAVMPGVYYATPPISTAGYSEPSGGTPAVASGYAAHERSHSQSSTDTSTASVQQLTPPDATISEDDVEQLKEMFSSFELPVIRSILEASHGNKEEAINSLLQLAADSTPVPTQSGAALASDANASQI